MILDVEQTILDKLKLLNVPGKQLTPRATVMSARKQDPPEVGVVIKRKSIVADLELFRPYAHLYTPVGAQVSKTLPDGTVITGYNAYNQRQWPEPQIATYEVRWWSRDVDTDALLTQQIPSLYNKFGYLALASGKEVFVERGNTVTLDDEQTGVYEKMVKLTVSQIWFEVDPGQQIATISSVVNEYSFQ
jgi:hypothetical protein